MFVENFRKFMKYYGEGRKLKLFCFFVLSFLYQNKLFWGEKNPIIKRTKLAKVRIANKYSILFVFKDL